ALMHKPELLILDEPTSGLDPLIQSEFNKLLIEHKNSGGTAFISSHVLSEVQEICDTVAFIREGQIKAIRSMAEITNESPKDFMLTTNSKDLKRRLSKLSGVTFTSEDGNSIQGIFSGDVNELIRLISGYSIENFTLSDTELEAVFMKYYEGDK
ncbi:ABC transporter ATP-binding protein, partial [Candidatus Saccharibacteria bacterium]|nr:ABC transporter ATP-binding protein [Candidatus Saccharibacteria bacterium]